MERQFSILLHAYAILHVGPIVCSSLSLFLPACLAHSKCYNQQQQPTTNSNKRQYIHIINFTIRRMKKGERRASGSTAIIALSLNARRDVLKFEYVSLKISNTEQLLNEVANWATLKWYC